MESRVSQIQARVANRQVAPLSGGTSARRLGAPRVAGNQPAGAGWKPKAPNLNQREGIGPGVAVGGPAAPGAPGPPPALAQKPWNAQYERAAGAAEKNYGDKLSNLGAQKVISQQNFGIDPGFNDYANNPYSRAALLRKSYEANAKGDTNSYAARGQLYAGSLANAQEADQGNYNQGYNTLNKEYLANLGGLSQEGARAKETEENEINEAAWRALEVAQGEPIEPVPGKGKGKGALPGKGAGKKGLGKFPFYPTPKSLPGNVNSRAKIQLGQARKAR